MSLVPFDDRDGKIWMDGRLIEWRDAKVHVLTHGLHYASAVFEGERVYNGEIYALRAHTERLIDSARILGFEIPFSADQIDQACKDTVAAQGFDDAYVRPIAWRGSEQMGVSAKLNKIHLAIAVWQWPSYFDPETKMKGIRCMVSEWKRPSPETIPCRAKAAGLYMICTLSKHKAEDLGFADAMMFDYRGYVAEMTGANIFFIKDGKIHTPKPDCFLDGITRQSVIKLARARQMEVIERHITADEIAGFSECFITGSAAEVTPVSEIGDWRFTPGQITKLMVDDYDALVRRKS